MTHDEHSLGALMGNTVWPRTDKRKKFLHLLFTDAMETGIGTWAHLKEYHWANDDDSEDVDGFYAVLTPLESKDWGEATAELAGKKELRVDMDVIECGLMRFWELCLGERDKLGYPDSDDDCNYTQLGPQAVVGDDDYRRQMLLMDLTNGDYGDYDAYTLSDVIELALFNQLVYA